jgi:hypothetical protein
MKLTKDINICNHELEYAYTIDKAVPGDIVSTAIFKCIKCGEEFNEWEIDNDNRRKRNQLL